MDSILTQLSQELDKTASPLSPKNLSVFGKLWSPGTALAAPARERAANLLNEGLHKAFAAVPKSDYSTFVQETKLPAQATKKVLSKIKKQYTDESRALSRQVLAHKKAVAAAANQGDSSIMSRIHSIMSKPILGAGTRTNEAKLTQKAKKLTQLKKDVDAATLKAKEARQTPIDMMQNLRSNLSIERADRKKIIAGAVGNSRSTSHVLNRLEKPFNAIARAAIIGTGALTSGQAYHAYKTYKINKENRTGYTPAYIPPPMEQSYPQQ